MSIVAKKVLKRLREENSEALKDASPKENLEYDLSKLNADGMMPSELKELTEVIARKRLTASGLSQIEAQALLKRIGH